ncbi:hypothetical protein L228DRAFT_250304, partial [Xylona heveae TC161]
MRNDTRDREKRKGGSCGNSSKWWVVWWWTCVGVGVGLGLSTTGVVGTALGSWYSRC